MSLYLLVVHINVNLEQGDVHSDRCSMQHVHLFVWIYICINVFNISDI